MLIFVVVSIMIIGLLYALHPAFGVFALLISMFLIRMRANNDNRQDPVSREFQHASNNLLVNRIQSVEEPIRLRRHAEQFALKRVETLEQQLIEEQCEKNKALKRVKKLERKIIKETKNGNISVTAKVVLPDGIYHIRRHSLAWYFEPWTETFQNGFVGSVDGQVQLINFNVHGQASILLRYVELDLYLAVEEDGFNSVSFSHESSNSNWMEEEFELVNAPYKKNIDGAVCLRSIEANMKYLRLFPQFGLMASEFDIAKATTFVFEPRKQFLTSIQTLLPSGVYHILLNGTNEYFVGGIGSQQLALGKTTLTPHKSHQKTLFKLEWNEEDGDAGTLSFSSPESGKYLCRGKWKFDCPFTFKSVQRNGATKFELVSMTADGFVTLRDIEAGYNNFLNGSHFSMHLILSKKNDWKSAPKLKLEAAISE